MSTESNVSQGQLDDIEKTWLSRLDLLAGDLYNRVNKLSEQFAKVIGGVSVVAFLFSAGGGLLVYHVNFAVSTFQSSIKVRDEAYQKDIDELKKSLERIEKNTSIRKSTELKIATNP